MQRLHIVIVDVERARVDPVLVKRSSGCGEKLWVVAVVNSFFFFYFSLNTVDRSLFSANQVAVVLHACCFSLHWKYWTADPRGQTRQEYTANNSKSAFWCEHAMTYRYL